MYHVQQFLSAIEVPMKTCLLCDHKENSKTKASPNVSFLCSQCVQKLVRTPREDVTKRYRESVQAGRMKEAWALISFVPRKVRDEYPCKKPTSGKL
jgi:hypothetical protein